MKIAAAFRFGNKEYYTVINDNEEMTFGTHKKDKINVPETDRHFLIIKNGYERITYSFSDGPTVTAELNKIIVLDQARGIILYLSRVIQDSYVLEIPYQGRFSCGRAPDNDMQLTYPIISSHHFLMMSENGQIHIEDTNSTNHLYLNGSRITKANMKNGDVLSIYTFRFILRNGTLCFENMGSSLLLPRKRVNNFKEAPSPVSPQSRNSSKYLEYHLSPRTREQLPHEDIILSAAPSQMRLGSRRGNFAYMLGTGAMMAANLATGIISPQALLMRLTGMISPVANMAMYRKMGKEEKKQVEEYEQMRQETYRAYIDDQKARINKIADVQRRVVTAENRSPKECLNTVMNFSRSLWERMPEDSDFLETRLGIGKDKLCVPVRTRADADGFKMDDDDELEKLSEQIIEETRYVDQIPIRVSVRKYQTIGIVGSEQKRMYQLRNMIVELSSQHSFKDLKLVGLFDKKEQNIWGSVRWIPHFSDNTSQVRTIAFDSERIEIVAEQLNEIIKQRQTKASSDNHNKEHMILPHYVVIVTDRYLLTKYSLYDILISNNPNLGITTIFLGEALYDLPQPCQYIIDLSSEPFAFEREKYDERLYFRQDEVIHSNEIEAYARKMSAIELEDRAVVSQVPSSISFLGGYHVNTIDELHILERWNNSEPYETLAAPIGMMAGDKVFSLDIRSGEKAHGPHGLLAGTTGSGKSELLQTWILSMAVNYHPHDVNFVIIDYKGGGMSDLLEPLPHVVGKITNIDRNIGRSLLSLKSELKRRERLFAEAQVNNIDKYQRAYKNGQVNICLPHLIIVTDEFAEMKKEEPEFMAELNSVATTGRSLGIHMILATQKPAGVVNDQINSNSRFRICMKVQDVADSREMLKRPDAAMITQAGRAYVKVGEDELFEMFQSFYSGAEYSEESIRTQQSDNLVRVVGVVGNKINPLPKKKKSNQDEEDQLTAIIKHINKLCSMMKIKKLEGPWKPELQKWIPLKSLEDKKKVFNGKKWPGSYTELKVPIGVYDIPALQEQGTLFLNFDETGHYGIYGNPQSGKTTLLKTIIMSLGMHYRPDEVNISIIDSGGWSLTEFEKMPHVTEVIRNDEEKKILAFSIRINQELENRKKSFREHSVNSLRAYHETVSGDIPAQIVIIDNYTSLLEQYPDFESVTNSIAANGASYGVYLIYTSVSTIGMRYKFTQMIAGAIALQMSEKGEYANIVGPINNISLPYNSGRALMRNVPPVAFQTAMYIDEQDDKKRAAKLAELLQKMTECWRKTASGHVGKQAVQKDDVIADTMMQDGGRATDEYDIYAAYEKRDMIPLGLDAEESGFTYAHLAEDSYLLLVSALSEDLLKEKIDQIEKILTSRNENQIFHINSKMRNAEIQNLIDNLVNQMNTRKTDRNKNKIKSDFNQEKWIAGYTQICLIFDDIVEFTKAISDEQRAALGRILVRAAYFGVIGIAAATSRQCHESRNPLLDAFISKKKGLLIGGTPNDHGEFNLINSDIELRTHALLDDEMAYVNCDNISVIHNR